MSCPAAPPCGRGLLQCPEGVQILQVRTMSATVKVPFLDWLKLLLTKERLGWNCPLCFICLKHTVHRYDLTCSIKCVYSDSWINHLRAKKLLLPWLITSTSSPVCFCRCCLQVPIKYWAHSRLYMVASLFAFTPRNICTLSKSKGVSFVGRCSAVPLSVWLTGNRL